MAKKTLVSPSTGGLEIRRAEQYVAPGSFLQLANADLTGQSTLSMRNGYAEIEPPPGTEEPYALFYRENELCVARDASLFSYSENTKAWTNKGTFFPGRLRERGLSRSLNAQDKPDIAELDGNLVLVWERPGLGPDTELFFVVHDRDTLARITPVTMLASAGANPRVVAIQTWVAVCWFEENAAGAPVANRRIYISVWEPGDAAPGAPSFLATNNLQRSYSIAATDKDTVLIAYGVSGVPQLVEERAKTGSIQIVSQGATTNNDVFHEIIFTPQNANAFALYVAIGGGSTLRTRWLNSSLASLAEDTIAAQFAGPDFAPVAVERSSTAAHVAFSNNAAPASNRGGVIEYYTATYDGGSSSLTFNATSLGIVQLARPVVIRGRVLQPVFQNDITGSFASGDLRSSLQSAFAIHDVDSITIVGRLIFKGAGTAKGPAVEQEAPGSALRIGDTVRVIGTYTIEGTNPTTAFGGRFVIHDCDYAPRPVTAAIHKGIAHMPGCGFGYLYDGSAIVELDFHGIPTSTFESTAVGVIPDGTYSYAVFYEWEDDQGQVYRSALKVFSLTLAGGGVQVTLQIIALNQTQRPNVRIGIARTQESAANDPEFYRLDDPLNPLDNKTTVQTINFVDNNTDATIINNATLDQASASPITPNAPTPLTDFVVVASDRLWFGDPSDGPLIRFSKPFRSGFGIALGTTFAVRLDSSRRATAVGIQDRTFFGFTDSTVHYWGGAGPDAGNAGAQFALPSIQPAEIGATGQNTVLTTPWGLVYVSTQGPRLISRSRGDSNPFEAIHEAWEFLAQNTTALIYRSNDAELVMFDDGPDVSLDDLTQRRLTLRWHFPTRRASHDTLHQAKDAASDLRGGSAFLRTDNVVCASDDSYSDGQIPIVLQGVSPWMRTDSRVTPSQGPYQLQIVGQWLSPHTLTVTVLKNYEPFALGLAVGFDPTVKMDPERDGLRDTPEVWSDSSGQSYLLRRQIAGARIYAIAIAFRLDQTPLEPGPAAALNAIEVLAEDFADGKFMPLDPRRVY